MEEKSDTELTEARPYQLELLDAALDGDTIVLLGTGAGKTFIAVMLIKQLSYSIISSYKEDLNAKRTMFLVNTVPLVTQQADYIRAHTPLKVGHYYGEMGVDSWNQAKWNNELDQNNILVMTRQIFLDILTHSYVNLSRINLIIFDECHHAVKNDPYVQIMKFYPKCPENNRPRILGLSASIISGKCKPQQLERKLKDLEETLHCRTETAGDLAEVAKYATNPDETLVCYSSRSLDSQTGILKPILDKIVEFLECHQKSKSKDSVDVKLRGYLEECVYALDNISITSAIEAVELMKIEIEDILENHPNNWESKLTQMVLLNLDIFAVECKKALKNEGDDHSPKFTSLLHILADTNPCLSNSPDKVCSIVFVERRSTAVCLARLIQQHHDGCLGHLNCSFIVGHTGRGGRILEQGANMNVKKQQEVLRKFRTGQLNLLVATSVVEEGLDIPKCNLVVRYDFPKTFQSHVQSKGRARAKNSRYLLLVNREDYADRRSDLDCYFQLEKKLEEICHGREVPGEDEVEKRLKHLIEPYQPYGVDGPQMTIDGSLSLLHRYCQKLPHDRFTILAPVFEDENVGGGICQLDQMWYPILFAVKIQLPMNCPVKELKAGPPLPRVNLAKKAAALEAIKQLHIEGELDDHLKPISHKDVDSDEEDEVKMTAKKKTHAGTQRKVMYYRNEVAKCLHNSKPVPGDNHLYGFIMKLNGKLYPSQDNSDQPYQTLGILTNKPIPFTKIPPFSLYIGRSEVSVSLVPLTNLALVPHEIQVYEEFHSTLFKKIPLNIEFSTDVSNSDPIHREYLIVPVSIVMGTNPLVYYLDNEIVQRVLAAGSGELQVPTWPCDWTNFIGTLVRKKYTEEFRHGQYQLYEVTNIEHNETPLTNFPSDQSITYAQYFLHKYNYEIQDYTQPSLTCKPVSMGKNSLKLVSSRFKDQESEQERLKGNEIKLFPELCQIYPLSASFWKLCRCVPTIIYRIEALLVINELSDLISKETAIGCTSSYEYSTQSELSSAGQSDLAVRNLNSLFYWSTGEPVDPNIMPQLEQSAVMNGTLRKPDNGLLLQSLTTKSANDSIDLERLESLGDSFLKLSTTVDLFCCRSNDHEGKLNSARERRISNFNLSYLSKQKDIPGRLFSKEFDPHSNWIPPCFSLSNGAGPSTVAPQELSEGIRCYYYHRATDKDVADGIEAMLGAYIIAGGIEAGFKWLRWLGMKFSSPARLISMDDDDQMDVEVRLRSASQESFMSIELSNDAAATIKNPLLIQNSSFVFHTQCQVPPPALLHPVENADAVIKKMIFMCLPTSTRCNYTPLCEKINWTFKDPALLLQALTHPSFQKNHLTDSYQRLEFLGDAVLDYLITCFIYCQFPNYTPGQITEMRSALVNNITFAEIAVKELGLHTYLLQLSPGLFKQITEFVDSLERVSKPKPGESKSEIYCRFQSQENSDDTNQSELTSSQNMSETEAVPNDCEDVEELEPPKALGDVLESLAGALFLDSGMSLEVVWNIFYPFFKPLIDKFRDEGVPVHPIKKLLELASSVIIEKSPSQTRSHRCSVKVVDKGIHVTCVAKTYKAAKVGAAKRAIEKIKELKTESNFNL